MSYLRVSLMANMFSKSILFCLLLTFIINFVIIACTATRIVGVRTKKIASTNSLFNLIILISQLASSLQAPLLANYFEKSIVNGEAPPILIFRIIILTATMGALCGALSIPTVQRFMVKGVDSLYMNNSIFRVITKSFKKSTIHHFRASLKFPDKLNFYRLKNYSDIKVNLILLNMLVYGFTTVSVLSCLYAGYINPSFRTTALSLSGIANGVGTIGLMLFVEPYNSILTDRVLENNISDAYFRKYLTFAVTARFLGTILSQLILIPLAYFIAKIASLL